MFHLVREHLEGRLLQNILPTFESIFSTNQHQTRSISSRIFFGKSQYNQGTRTKLSDNDKKLFSKFISTFFFQMGKVSGFAFFCQSPLPIVFPAEKIQLFLAFKNRSRSRNRSEWKIWNLWRMKPGNFSKKVWKKPKLFFIVFLMLKGKKLLGFSECKFVSQALLSKNRLMCMIQRFIGDFNRLRTQF